MIPTALALSTAASLFGGYTSMIAAQAEAGALRQQGEAAYRDYLAQADKTVTDAGSYRETQAVSYLKSGVQLEGTPLGVLLETAARAQDEATALARRGYAERALAGDKANIAESQGRAALFAGIGSGLGSIAKIFG